VHKVVPLPAGQTVNRGAYACSSFLICTRTVTEPLTLVALQTQIAKLAVCPGWIRAALENGWTRTHSCGGLDDLLGLGEGLAVLVGDLVGAGLDLGGLVCGVGLFPDVELALGFGLLLADLELLALGLGLFGGSDVPLLVELGRALAEVVLVLAGAGLDLVACAAGEVLLALGCALADRLAAGFGLRARFDVKVSELSSSAVFGRLAHADALADAAACAVPAPAMVTPTALEEQTTNPVKAPTTVSRASLALTRPTSPRLTCRLRT